MNILVTGAAGYIGSILVPELLRRKNKVTAIDNFMYNQNSLLDCCSYKDLTIIRGDCRDRQLVGDSIKKADFIIPLACLTGAPLCAKDPFNAQTTNFDAVKMIMGLRSPSQPIIFPTTNSGYGVGEKGVCCTEATPLNPVSLYGRLKTSIEKALLDSGNCITLRLATVFGVSPRMRLDLLVNDFTYRAANDRFLVLFEGHFKRNFLHVRDAARAFIHSMENYALMKDAPYNVGLSSANLSKLELCRKIKEHLPDFYFIEAAVGEDIDKRDYIVSNRRMEEKGFSAEVSLDEGIGELIKGYAIIKKNQYSNV
ncbi:MAG: NAD(P)-dependent oxidoreductase [Deltaproteobacteria bacterium]|nr:NAD(P)-dependent oxidoreductase [Deltaproteobacteria bacterium]